MKKRLSVIAMAAICIMLAGCEVTPAAHAPFSSEEIKGADYEDAITRLKDAGFESVATKEEKTDDAALIGKVKEVTINGDASYKEGQNYAATRNVRVVYYVEREQEPAKEEQAEQEPEPEPAQEKVYTADAASIKELAEDMFRFDYENLSVEWDDFDSAYAVKYKEKDVLSESTFVNLNVNRYIHFCQKAYTIDGVDRVRFDVTITGIDQFGQEHDIEGLSEIMTRETFEKFNWQNLEYRNIWEVFNDECYYFGVAPQIIGEVDTAQVFYTPQAKEGEIR